MLEKRLRDLIFSFFNLISSAVYAAKLNRKLSSGTTDENLFDNMLEVDSLYIGRSAIEKLKEFVEKQGWDSVFCKKPDKF